MSLSASTTTISLNGRTSTRKLQKTGIHNTPSKPIKSLSKPTPVPSSQSKLARTRLQQPKKSLDPRTPIVVTRRPSVPLNVISEEPSKTSPRSPLLNARGDLKTRLPRIVPTPRNRNLDPKKSTKAETLTDPQPSQNSTATPLASSLTTTTTTTTTALGLALKPSPTPSSSSHNTGLNHTIDPDRTPRKLAPRISSSSLTTSVHNHSEAGGGKPNHSDLVSRRATALPDGALIPFPSIIEETTPKRPFTRARSKQLINPSIAPSKAPEQPTTTGIPQIRRQPSRIKQITEALQREVESNNSPVHSTTIARQPSSSSLLMRKASVASDLAGGTPDRRPSNRSFSSMISPPDSFGNSPNITALAASMSRQHGQRDLLNRDRAPRSPPLVDAMRLSTTSTLGALKWEDGVGDVLLTDPNETEAMVADISMTIVTPLKSEAQSAAVALASARANFLNLVQANHPPQGSASKAEGGEPRIEKGHNSNNHPIDSPSVGSQLRKRTSSNLLMKTNGSSTLSRSRKGISPNATTTNTTTTTTTTTPAIRQVLGRDAQVAALTESLEQSLQREMELRKEIERLQQEVGRDHPTMMSRRRRADGGGSGGRTISIVKKLSDQERERSLVEEIQRLEAELEESKELNIELENSVDQLKFESLENHNKLARLNDQHQSLLSRFHHHPHPPSSSALVGPAPHEPATPASHTKPASAVSSLQTDGHLLEPMKMTKKATTTFLKFETFDRELVAELKSLKDHLTLLRFIKLSLALSFDLLPPLPSSTTTTTTL